MSDTASTRFDVLRLVGGPMATAECVAASRAELPSAAFPDNPWIDAAR